MDTGATVVSEHLIDWCVSNYAIDEGSDDVGEAEDHVKAEAGAKVGVRLDIVNRILKSGFEAVVAEEGEKSSESSLETLKNIAIHMHGLEAVFKRSPIWVGVLVLRAPLFYINAAIKLETIRAQRYIDATYDVGGVAFAKAECEEEHAFARMVAESSKMNENGAVENTVQKRVQTLGKDASAAVSSGKSSEDSDTSDCDESVHEEDDSHACASSERELIRDWVQEFYSGTLRFYTTVLCNVEEDDVVFLCTNPMSVFVGTASKCVIEGLREAKIDLGHFFGVHHLGIGDANVVAGVAAALVSADTVDQPEVKTYIKNAGEQGILACLRNPQMVANGLETAHSGGQVLFVTIGWNLSIAEMPIIMCDYAQNIDAMRMRTAEVIALREQFRKYQPLYDTMKELQEVKETGFDPDTITSDAFNAFQKSGRRLGELQRRVFEYSVERIENCTLKYTIHAELIAMAESARVRNLFDETTPYKFVLIVQDTVPYPPLYFYIDLQLTEEDKTETICNVLKAKAGQIMAQLGETAELLNLDTSQTKEDKSAETEQTKGKEEEV